uniref:Tetratricopeptide repeat-containing protein n=1 Tax=Candidatus Kentrum sp. DK TaxID=2126562 RepID=A0A450SDD1_9GAMM|nr:MAG: hypothetical protein BECKDK2373C_GA0170839_102910 [Candidatus Kentron sp. DK]
MPKWIAIFALLFGLNSICGATETQSDCDAPELVEGSGPEYNQLVCDGARLMAQGYYGEATKAFEAAMKIPFLDMPNFKLFPRLALAYFMAGEREKATENLEKADLSLSVLTGIVRCKEDDRGLFFLVHESGKRIDNIDIVHRMCGAAYDYFYGRYSLEQVLQDAELVRRYFDIRDRIQQPEGEKEKPS